MMRKIILIEDNAGIRENTTEILELAGYSVLAAANGKGGLQLINENVPDIILCDIWMPEVSGFDVFREVKAKPALSNIPFIFFTASAEKSEIESGLGMGAYAYITKPFEDKELLDTIERCLLSSEKI